ncbi:hypothetical protein BC939DRAFT_188705 [Gamsiella multidivaricata]|uniref:uncharacterized protein n=1 Tax=Gamsiella multidivaricata TaxID=101098 RepID=UPI0022206135|nr:uncharacterized protein BC939DRAFT_188705 [Gamsiella multidivaricata]KAI7831547.1 hypothetical protein BC939DRAFT_188705 [Gamsiella multidivaricata]
MLSDIVPFLLLYTLCFTSRWLKTFTFNTLLFLFISRYTLTQRLHILSKSPIHLWTRNYDFTFSGYWILIAGLPARGGMARLDRGEEEKSEQDVHSHWYTKRVCKKWA